MKKFSLKEILSISLDVGERMLKCGAEVSRVEKTITIICESYGVKYKEVFAMNSLIVATLRDENDSVTESRRIAYHENDLGQLERLNDLSRSICKKNVSRKIVLSKYSSNVRQASPAFCTQRGASVVRMIRISFTPMASSFFAVSSIASQFRRFIFVCTLTGNPFSTQSEIASSAVCSAPLWFRIQSW